jgi:hypothetical protein
LLIALKNLKRRIDILKKIEDTKRRNLSAGDCATVITVLVANKWQTHTSK